MRTNRMVRFPFASCVFSLNAIRRCLAKDAVSWQNFTNEFVQCVHTCTRLWNLLEFTFGFLFHLAHIFLCFVIRFRLVSSSSHPLFHLVYSLGYSIVAVIIICKFIWMFLSLWFRFVQLWVERESGTEGRKKNCKKRRKKSSNYIRKHMYFLVLNNEMRQEEMATTPRERQRGKSMKIETWFCANESNEFLLLLNLILYSRNRDK